MLNKANKRLLTIIDDNGVIFTLIRPRVGTLNLYFRVSELRFSAARAGTARPTSTAAWRKNYFLATISGLEMFQS